MSKNIDYLAEKIKEKRLEVPAIFLLESLFPFKSILNICFEAVSGRQIDIDYQQLILKLSQEKS